MLDEIIEKHCSQHFRMGALGKSKIERACHEYAKHVMRWRAVSELPPDGNRMKCSIDNGAVETQHFIKGVDERRIQQHVGWRPIYMPVQPDWFIG